MRLIIVLLSLLFITPAFAGGTPRTVDFTTVLLDQDDKPFTECVDTDCKSKVQITLGRVALRALSNPEQGMKPEDSVLRGDLALRVYKAKDVILTPEDTVLIKQCIAKLFGPLIVVRSFQLLDPK
jgi:hypothetical protein